MSHRRYLAIIKQQDHNLPIEERENAYSHTVLLGNWFEERFASEIDRKAITPGIYGESKCLMDKTLYKSDFKVPIKMVDQEKCEEFMEWKQQGFSNRLNGEKTNIKLCDGEQFDRNITTFKDIMYRIKPKEEGCVNDNVLSPKKGKVNDDFMRSYGNSTQTGLLKWRQCERLRDEATPMDLSNYKNNFKPVKIPANRCLHKAEQRKTSI